MKEIVSHYLKPYYPRMGVGFLIKFIGTIMDLCIPYILAHIIDYIIPLQQKNLVFYWGMLMIVCSFIAVSFNIIANRMASKVASLATEKIRYDLFSKTMYLSNAQTDGFTKPSLISRMTSDTYHLHRAFGMMQRLGVRAPILLLGGIAVTFTLDAFMALILLAILPLLGVLSFYVSRRSIPMYGGLQEASDRFVRMVREDIAGIRVIKALSKNDYEISKFRGINKEVVERERKAGMVMAIINPAMNILLNLGLVCVIVVGAFRVNAGTSEVGKILAFTTYFTIILNAMLTISRMFTMLSKAIASGNRIWEVLESEEDLQVLEKVYENSEDKENGESKDGSKSKDSSKNNDRREALEGIEGIEGTEGTDLKTAQMTDGCSEDGDKSEYEIVFDHVSFSYLKQEDANIQDISFKIRKGETLGIIGEIGSGKSTLINLMMRLYEADAGEILISGKDVRSYKPEDLKKKFGVVFQNDTIFEDTIAGNVTLGRDLSEEQLQEALLYAQAREFVEARADKASESLNIKGANLSGGQKQRVLIARALAAKPEILILDDSSSALDYRTDAALRKGIKEHFEGTTLVIVAQRVSSIRNADHILVLEDGRAIGYGTHEELMAGCEVYNEISHSQMGEEVEPA